MIEESSTDNSLYKTYDILGKYLNSMGQHMEAVQAWEDGLRHLETSVERFDELGNEKIIDWINISLQTARLVHRLGTDGPGVSYKSNRVCYAPSKMTDAEQAEWKIEQFQSAVRHYKGVLEHIPEENKAFEELEKRGKVSEGDERDFIGSTLMHLIKNHQSVCTVKGAANALAEMKYENIFDVLERLLPQDVNPFFPMDIPKALGKLGDSRAIPLLIKIIENPMRQENDDSDSSDEIFSSGGKDRLVVESCLALASFIIRSKPINEYSSNDEKSPENTENHHDVLAVQTNKDAFKFLTEFGYNPCDSPTGFKSNDFTGPSCQVSMENMLENFQKKYNLPVTKKLDVRTLKLMNTPRCGVPDSLSEIVDRSSLWPKDRILKWKLHIGKLPFDHNEIREAIRQAFDDWAGHGGLTFYEANESETPDFNVSFVIGDHGDGAPINEPTTVLAHAFYPWDFTFRGRIHFNSVKNWTKTYDGVGYNLRLTATHEIGHSLGVPHSDDSDSIMYPTYQVFQPDAVLPES
ncbi:unnamed protein product, partial [Rotaria sp. Silwood1]